MKVKCPFCGTLCFDNCQDEYKEMMEHIKSHVDENKELKKQVEELEKKLKRRYEMYDESQYIVKRRNLELKHCKTKIVLLQSETYRMKDELKRLLQENKK